MSGVSGKTALVTGVSSGLGAAISRRLAALGHHVFGSVPAAGDGDALHRELGENFTPLILDINKQDQIDRVVSVVEAKLGGKPLSALINNAGICMPGPILEVPLKEIRQHLETNLIGHIAVTRAMLPLLMRNRDESRIVMMSSVSGECVFPFIGAYGISKFGLEAFADALRRELLPFGVKVITIAPSSANTPIWDKAASVDLGQYRASMFHPWMSKAVPAMIAAGRHGIPTQTVADTVAKALTSANPKTRYRISQKPILSAILRALPVTMLDRFLTAAAKPKE